MFEVAERARSARPSFPTGVSTSAIKHEQFSHAARSECTTGAAITPPASSSSDACIFLAEGSGLNPSEMLVVVRLAYAVGGPGDFNNRNPLNTTANEAPVSAAIAAHSDE